MIVPFSIWPPHFGSSERAYNISKRLAMSDEFEVTVLYTDYIQVATPDTEEEHWPGVEIRGIGPSKRWAQLLNPCLVWRGLGLILKERPDVILGEHLWSALNTILLHILTGVPYVLDEHNAEYIRLARMRRGWVVSLVRLLEVVACRLASAVICVSEVDKNYLLSLGVTRDRYS